MFQILRGRHRQTRYLTVPLRIQQDIRTILGHSDTWIFRTSGTFVLRLIIFSRIKNRLRIPLKMDTVSRGRVSQTGSPGTDSLSGVIFRTVHHHDLPIVNRSRRIKCVTLLPCYRIFPHRAIKLSWQWLNYRIHTSRTHKPVQAPSRLRCSFRHSFHHLIFLLRAASYGHQSQ